MSEGLAVLSFEVWPGEALHRQITRHIRGLIQAGNLASGTKLPRMHDLAIHWNTNYFTVHTALTELVRDGLLERKPRLGTFVRKQSTELQSIGIYYGDEILIKQERAFFRALHAQLIALLNKEKISSRLFIDHRPAVRRGEPFPELAEAVSSGAIQGLIIPLESPSPGKWIRQMPIPTSLFGSRMESTRITIDYDELMTVACKTLSERNCKTVGLISPTSPHETSKPDDKAAGIIGAFHARAAAFGLKTKPGWIRMSKTAASISQENFGYQEFHKLWALPEKPDGLIVYPDMTGRGVALAMLELQVQAPEELKLVLHRNQYVEFLCPVPADWIITREKDVAKALLQQIKDRFGGLKPHSYDIHPTLVKRDDRPDKG